MSAAERENTDWKRRLRRELIEYGLTFFYLALFFGVFTWYRRLILAEYKITYLHYGASLIKALVLAKLVALGGALGLDRQDDGKPLIVATLRNTFVFSLWVGVFDLLERTLIAYLHGQGLLGGIHEVEQVGADELLVRCLLTFFAFIPFFAFRALGKVLGEGKVGELFFRKKERRTGKWSDGSW